jgi:hypothetical protein
VNVPAAQLSTRRVTTHQSNGQAGSFLVLGGPQRFLEHCPDHGCLAVVLDRQGLLVRKYPYLPDEFAHGTLADLPYEQMFMRLELDVTPVSGLRVAGDDLLVTFHFDESFPYGGGTARVSPSGKVVWYRRDYSNHWASFLSPNEIAVVSGSLSRDVVRQQFGPFHGFTVGCHEGYVRDTIEVLTVDGVPTQEIRLLDAMMDSPFRSYLMASVPSFSPVGTCDPMHANYVARVGPEIAAGFTDVDANDLLVSMRNLSSLGIVSRTTGKFTHLLRGTFHYQHSAQPVPGGRILLVDNLGASPGIEGTRYLLFDPRTGREEVLFPRPGTPEGTPTTTPAAGNIRLARDGKTVWIASTYAGRGYEVNLETGALVTTFDNLHDLRTTGLADPADGNQIARFKLWDVSFWE